MFDGADETGHCFLSDVVDGFAEEGDSVQWFIENETNDAWREGAHGLHATLLVFALIATLQAAHLCILCLLIVNWLCSGAVRLACLKWD